MKKLIFIFAVILFSSAVSAETIKLNTGVEISGEIIDRGEDSVKIKLVEGTEVTYYFDEIDNLEALGLSQKNEERPVKGSTNQIVIDYSQDTPTARYLRVTKAIAEAKQLTDLREIISEEKYKEMIEAKDSGGFKDEEEILEMLKAFTATEIVVLSETIFGNKATLVVEGTGFMGRGKAEVEMVKKDGKWMLEKESWKSGEGVELKTTAPLSGGNGSAKGKVVLPELEEFPEKGSLFVLMTKKGSMLPVYEEISYEETKEGKTGFEFNDVESGDYYLTAIWDIAEPHIDLDEARRNAKEWGVEEDTIAAYISAQDDDYRSEWPLVSVTIKKDENTEGIVVECPSKVKMIWTNDKEHYEQNYEFTAFEMKTDGNGKPKIIVKAKNHGEKNVGSFNLTVLINGWMTNTMWSGNRIIESKAEKEFDITGSFESYFGDSENDNKPKDELFCYVFGKENGNMIHQKFSFSQEMINKLNIERWDKPMDPDLWGLKYKLVGLRAEKDTLGEYKYFLRVKNDSEGEINQMNLAVISNGNFSNFGQVGTLPGPGEEKEYDITFNANVFQEEAEKKSKDIHVIGTENNEYLNEHVVLD